MRRHLRLIRLVPWLFRSLLVSAVAAAVIFLWQAAQPQWIEVFESAADVITLNGGHYFQRQLRTQPIAETSNSANLTATNAIDRQFQKMFATRYRRRPIFIQGHGTFKCPDVVGCDIHLAAGITFITTGRFTPDGFLIKSPVPPADADETHHIGYPSYIIEKGAKLIFTDNNAYPTALIRQK